MKNVYEIDTFSLENYYLENFGKYEASFFTEEELYYMYHICKVSRENETIEFAITFPPCSYSFCLYKDPRNKWVVLLDSGEKESYIYGTFDNIYDAIICLISNYSYGNKQKILAEFNNSINSEIGKEELEDFAILYGLKNELYYSDFCYMIKKISGIDVLDDEQANARISKRNRRNSLNSFPVETMNFISHITQILNVDLSDLNNKWLEGKIEDYNTYVELCIKYANLKEHQDLVLTELETYYDITNQNLGTILYKCKKRKN